MFFLVGPDHLQFGGVKVVLSCHGEREERSGKVEIKAQKMFVLVVYVAASVSAFQ